MKAEFESSESVSVVKNNGMYTIASTHITMHKGGPIG